MRPTYTLGSALLGLIIFFSGGEDSQHAIATAELCGPRITQMLIDIKPDDFPNGINPRSNGTIPVAILTNADFNAHTVDPKTVRFGKTGTEAPAVQSALEDVDRDGDLDLLLHFRIHDTSIHCGHTSASLTAQTSSGQRITGSDSIVTVGCR